MSKLITLKIPIEIVEQLNIILQSALDLEDIKAKEYEDKAPTPKNKLSKLKTIITKFYRNSCWNKSEMIVAIFKKKLQDAGRSGLNTEWLNKQKAIVMKFIYNDKPATVQQISEAIDSVLADNFLGDKIVNINVVLQNMHRFNGNCEQNSQFLSQVIK
jgi:hypothetical protein